MERVQCYRDIGVDMVLEGVEPSFGYLTTLSTIEGLFAGLHSRRGAAADAPLSKPIQWMIDDIPITSHVQPFE